MACRPDLPLGCPRCMISDPTICCELCTPAHFEDFARVTMDKAKNRPSRSRLPDKDYKATSQDMKLRDALHSFRKEQTILEFGRACLRNTGPSIIMADDVLQRIVDCAHFHLIESPLQLAKETRWSRVDQHGVEVVSLIMSYCPKPVPAMVLTTAPLRSIHPPNQTQNGSSVVLPVRTVATRRCGVCKQLGHISE